LMVWRRAVMAPGGLFSSCADNEFGDSGAEALQQINTLLHGTQPLRQIMRNETREVNYFHHLTFIFTFICRYISKYSYQKQKQQWRRVIIREHNIGLGWRQDNGNRSNQESKSDFLATRQ